MTKILAPKQIEFILKSTKRFNLAWGSMRAGKTVAITYRFMQAAHDWPDSDIWMIGHTSSTIYDNVVSLILNPPAKGIPDPLAIYRPFCTWHESKRELRYGNKTIHTVGAKDKSAANIIQGKTISLFYCDEMTLYDPYIIDTIQTRLSRPHSMLFASMNPTYPSHKLKKWIDFAKDKDPSYYELQFTVDDNPFLTETYKRDLKKSLSGVFYKRNYLGEWCLAEGAIFDFFDRQYHVVSRPPRAGEYWIAGVDFGMNNAFSCVLIGVNSGTADQSGKKWWVEKEYYWDPKVTGRQKIVSELARDVYDMLEPYGVRQVYVDPSALPFKEELKRMRVHVVNANNDVFQGIQKLTQEVKEGNLVIVKDCVNLIREMESYVWDAKKAERGIDEPIKKDDHAIDALRYAIATHKVSEFNLEDYNRKKAQEMRQQFDPFAARFGR